MTHPSPYRGRLPLLLILATALLAGSARADGFRRFALFVGNNDGGAGTRKLRFAHDDAERILEVLTRVGGLAREDAVLLREKRADDLRRALDRLEARIAQAAAHGQRAVLFVYYSGHAKDGALRLGDSIVTLDEIRRRIASSSAEVRLALFDSCRSGTVTRTKGVRRAPAFEVDTSALRAARGMVILTSSSADEDAQESDELGGSFFSHHFASGLLGGADSSGDGRVTLSEAYAYAYARTVADTAGTAAGVQHPTFSYDLAGNGDLVLTDLTGRREGVLIPASAPAGSYFLVDARGAIAAEVVKAVGVERRIALAPGAYRIKRRLADRLRIGELTVSAGQIAVLDEARLRDAPFRDDPVKGVRRRFEREPSWFVGAGAGFQGFFAGPFPSAPQLHLELELRNHPAESFAWLFDLALGARDAHLQLPGDRLPYRFGALGLGLSLLKDWELGPLRPYVGGRLGLVAMRRTFEDATLPAQGYAAMTPALVGGVRFRLAEHWHLVARARLNYLFYNIDRDQSLGYLDGVAIVSWDL